MKISIDRVKAYCTKDGSQIRELIHPDSDMRAQMSLAEAMVLPGRGTALHIHGRSQEIYHITRGCGVMSLGAKDFNVGPGDSILIPTGTQHKVKNTGDEPLKILCCCCPPYSHDDTFLLES